MESTEVFLKSVYREYYFKSSQTIEFPARMDHREFGYTQFGGGMVRHLSFKTPGAFLIELIKQGPSSVYCSNATYQRPTSPMEEKGWNGAELIFDIDADAVPSSCKTKHRLWCCSGCGRGGRTAKPSRCPYCGSANLADVHWACKECLTATKQHVYRLVDFLEKDFGTSRSDIRLYFSGNRGYHIHVYDGRFEPLDAQARAEIANYMTGTGITTRDILNSRGRRSDADYGWDARIVESIRSIGGESAKVSARLINQAVESQAVAIDQAVTIDVHRIFRMAGTLHGGSGLLKMRIDSLDTFDEESDPVVLGDEKMKIFVNLAPNFSMKGIKYGPYSSEPVEIPTYAAVYLLTKGLGRLN